MVGLLQIVTELPMAFDLVFPPAFASLLKAVQVLMLDFFTLFHLDCIGTISLHLKFIVTMATPAVCISFVVLVESIAHRRAARSGATPVAIAEERRQNRSKTVYPGTGPPSWSSCCTRS